MTTWYIIRHAEKELGDFYNPNLRHQDQPISRKGHLDAQKLRSFFADKQISTIYVSAYQRTCQTIADVAQQLQLTPIVDDRLNEIDNGCIEGLTDQEIMQKYPDVWNAYLERAADFRFPEGETGEEAQMWARPYQLHWGTTDEEVKRAMPGDELSPKPRFLATRAIAIEGAPGEIWPWLVQMGYNRAGFYGYDILENLGSTRGIRSADHILPEFQNFKVGDEVPISPAALMVFYEIEPDRYLIWVGKGSESKLEASYGA